MSTTSILLLMFCLGLANAHAKELTSDIDSDDYGKSVFNSLRGRNARSIAFPINADFIAKTFLAHFKIDLATRNANKMSKRFSESFLFQGCNGIYAKEIVLTLLGSVPKTSSPSITFKSAELVGDNVQFTVGASEFGIADFDAQLTLQRENGDFVLIEGKMMKCSARHIDALDAVDPVQEITLYFLRKLLRLIGEWKQTELAALIVDNFVFHGCKGNYNKEKVLDHLSRLVPGTQMYINLKSSQFMSDPFPHLTSAIKFTVLASGFGVPDFLAEFVIHADFTDHYLLSEGNAIQCSKRSLFAVESAAETIAKSFLAQFMIDLASRNTNKMAKRIAEDFRFHGCNGVYAKEIALTLLGSVPKTSSPSITFKSAESVGNNIQVTVVGSGFGIPDMNAQVTLQKVNGDYVLIKGKMMKCAARHFDALAATDGSEVIAEAFLGSLTRLIAAQDQIKLAALFSDNFSFHGCKGDYNKQKVLSLLSRLATNTKFSITFQSSQWINANADIQYTVLASGFGVPDFLAQFVLHQESGNYVLSGGNVPKCSKRP